MQRTLPPQFALVVFPCNTGDVPPFKWDGAMDEWRKTVVASQMITCIYSLQSNNPMRTLIPRLDNDSEVEIMVVARPMGGEEGTGAAAVGPIHRSARS